MSSFSRDMITLRQCKHPRIVQYVDCAIKTGDSCIHFYLIMEFMSQVSIKRMHSKFIYSVKMCNRVIVKLLGVIGKETKREIGGVDS